LVNTPPCRDRQRGVRVLIESVNLLLSFLHLAGAIRSSSRNPAMRIASQRLPLSERLRGSGPASDRELLRKDKNGSAPRRHPQTRFTGSPVWTPLNLLRAGARALENRVGEGEPIRPARCFRPLSDCF